jgi:hypothetical protein
MNQTDTPQEVVEKANEENKLSMEIFNNMRQKFLDNLPDEEREAYQKFGEKFHSSFDVNSGSSVNLSEINMEEALAYVVQGLESGLHPKYITEDEDALLIAAYGEEWYKKWNYETKTDI